MKKSIFFIMILGLVSLLTGCQSIALSPPSSSIENLQKVRHLENTSANLGAFSSKVEDKRLGLRAHSLISPVNDSFAQYLRKTLIVELETAGFLKESSKNSIRGEITENDLEAGASTGKATLAARFMVDSGGTIKYDKELRVSSTWESSFMAMIAVPKASMEYAAIYRKLVGKLFEDTDFQKAIKD